jgi:hypothetical protein
MSSDALHSFDVVIALHLLSPSHLGYRGIAEDLGLSVSTVYNGVQRLISARLVRASEDGSLPAVNRRALLEFLEHGVRYAFPATLGARTRGVPTAYAGPAVAGDIVSDEPAVWPDPSGPVVGTAVAPLLPKAAKLPSRCPQTYALLTAVDAFRVGRTRERRLASEYLQHELTRGLGS